MYCWVCEWMDGHRSYVTPVPTDDYNNNMCVLYGCISRRLLHVYDHGDGEESPTGQTHTEAQRHRGRCSLLVLLVITPQHPATHTRPTTSTTTQPQQRSRHSPDAHSPPAHFT